MGLMLFLLIFTSGFAANFLLGGFSKKPKWYTATDANLVINRVNASKDLVSYLKHQGGCDGHSEDSRNTEVILKEKDGFAKTLYGCGVDAYAYYKEVDGQWQSINSTNQLLGDTPSCSLVKEHGIPSSIDYTCFDNSKSELIEDVKLLENTN